MNEKKKNLLEKLMDKGRQWADNYVANVKAKQKLENEIRTEEQKVYYQTLKEERIKAAKEKAVADVKAKQKGTGGILGIHEISVSELLLGKEKEKKETGT